MKTRQALLITRALFVGATMHKNRDGNLKRVDCELRIKEEEQMK